MGGIRYDLKRHKFLHIKHDPPIGARDVLEADFIPLRISGRRKRQRRDGPDDLSSISSSERSTDASSSEEESGTSGSNENFQRKAGLSKQIDQNPTDWRTWIALVGLQDEVDGVLDTLNQYVPTSAERRSNAEVSLSIYQKALKSVTDSNGRERLYLGMMSKASVVWERAKLLAQWKTIQNEHPFSLPLWKSYLDFHQSTLHSFRLEDVRKQYQDGLDSLQKARDRQSLSQTQISDIYVVQVYLVLRLSLLLRQGGYSEVGVAIWQALLEFEYNRPSHLSHTKHDGRGQSRHSESVLDFEAFWDSEFPRIGEPNAKGWSNFGDDDIELPQAHADDDACFQANGNRIKAWADAERKAQNSSIIPGRTLDETSDDPYRIVLFSDIKSVLIESPTTPGSHIVSAFLCFCQLPSFSNEARSQIDDWFFDQFTSDQTACDGQEAMDSLSRMFNSTVSDNDKSRSEFGQVIDRPSNSAFEFPLVNYQVSPDVLFATPDQWFSVFSQWAKSLGNVPRDHVLRTLQMLVSKGTTGGDTLAEYVLGLELQLSPMTVRRSARRLLKNRPSSLRLYNAYALIEQHLGNKESGTKVYDTAIQMSAKLGEVAKRDVIMLWRSLVWQHFSAGESSMAIQRLSMFGLEHSENDRAGNAIDPASSTTRLQVRNVSPQIAHIVVLRGTLSCFPRLRMWAPILSHRS